MAQGVMAAGLSPDAAQRTAQRRPAAYSAAFTAALYSTRCCPSADGHKPRPVTAGFRSMDKESAESVDLAGGQTPAQRKPATPCFARYAKNMTADARNGRLDPVLCRNYEIDLMIDILCRRRKNNPVVVGEAGVGKSALIEGLALRIVAGQVPDKLKNTDIMTLDLGALQAGASVKGEFEKRLRG